MGGITINIPVYNEEALLVQNTKRLMDFLEKNRIEYEILLVSNGSTDRTIELGEKLQETHEQIRFFSIDKKGVGIAFRIALTNAKYEKMISMDMDLAVSLLFIPQAYRLLDDYTIVLGSKVLGNQKRSIFRKLGGLSYIYISKLLLGLNYHDYSIGGKGFRTQFLRENQKIIDDETNYVIALTLCAKKKNLKVIEIPVECVDNRASRFNLVREALYRYYMLINLLKAARSLR